VNAAGNGTLEYTRDGTTFQASNTFTNVPAGNYGITVRLVGNQACATAYNQNPVTIIAPTGCDECLTFPAPGLPLNITDNTTISSTINFNRSGTINAVKVKNLMGTHTYVSDLTFTLTSPQGTAVVLLANQCTSADNFNISLEDASATVLACPINDGSTKKPQNPLSAFNGQNPQGNWTLMVNENADQDVGTLTGWTLEVCGNFVNAACPPNLDIDYTIYVSSGTYQAENQVTCVGTIPHGSVVVLKAGDNIELKPNFSIDVGCTLDMLIQGCGN
jgi:subtilisin-like proprotein convertase family protein